MIRKIRKKISCNGELCEGVADYEIFVKKRKNYSKIYLCKDCFKKMYFEMGGFVPPKNPQNILNKFKK